MGNTSKAQERNTVRCTIVVEPRDLTYYGPSSANRGLGIFAKPMLRSEENSSSPTGERTRSSQVYSIPVSNEWEPQVEDFRIAYSRFLDFKEQFADPQFSTKVETFFNTVEEGKARLLNEHGQAIPAQAVHDLVDGMQPFNIGKCYRVHVVLNRHSDLPFRRAQRTKTGDYARTDRSASFWLPKVDDELIALMQEHLNYKDRPTKSDKDGVKCDLFWATRIVKDNGISTVSIYSGLTKRVEALVSSTDRNHEFVRSRAATRT